MYETNHQFNNVPFSLQLRMEYHVRFDGRMNCSKVEIGDGVTSRMCLGDIDELF